MVIAQCARGGRPAGIRPHGAGAAGGGSVAAGVVATIAAVACIRSRIRLIRPRGARNTPHGPVATVCPRRARLAHFCRGGEVLAGAAGGAVGLARGRRVIPLGAAVVRLHVGNGNIEPCATSKFQISNFNFKILIASLCYVPTGAV